MGGSQAGTSDGLKRSDGMNQGVVGGPGEGPQEGEEGEVKRFESSSSSSLVRANLGARGLIHMLMRV